MEAVKHIFEGLLTVAWGAPEVPVIMLFEQDTGKGVLLDKAIVGAGVMAGSKVRVVVEVYE